MNKIKHTRRYVAIFISMVFVLFAGILVKHRCFFCVSLPNGYTIRQSMSRQSYLTDRYGKKMVRDPVWFFAVKTPYIIGLVDCGRAMFFVLNTESGVLEIFDSEEAFDVFLRSHAIAITWMHDAVTFGDIKTGHRAPCWWVREKSDPPIVVP